MACKLPSGVSSRYCLHSHVAKDTLLFQQPLLIYLYKKEKGFGSPYTMSNGGFVWTSTYMLIDILSVLSCAHSLFVTWPILLNEQQ